MRVVVWSSADRRIPTIKREELCEVGAGKDHRVRCLHARPTRGQSGYGDKADHYASGASRRGARHEQHRQARQEQPPAALKEARSTK